MNAQTLIDIAKTKATEIKTEVNLGELFTFYRQFYLVYDICEGDEEQLKNLEVIKKHLQEAYDGALDLLRALYEIGRE